eukprot:TRINITY_DN14356_c0_g1_i1.p1 TRINITY_DN14356_c0_g1~~TRINITY_DN14356_c0_g1_i1.p1  ORF type:complete len:212 (-),score=10.27 TRINITY_DN14356_c0_g1_i1:66-701(-)
MNYFIPNFAQTAKQALRLTIPRRLVDGSSSLFSSRRCSGQGSSNRTSSSSWKSFVNGRNAVLAGTGGILVSGAAVVLSADESPKKATFVEKPEQAMLAPAAVASPAPKFRIFEPQVFSIGERVFLAVLTVLTAGVAFFLIYPWLAFQQLQASVSSMQIEGRRLRFDGKLRDYYMVHLKNWLLSLASLGIYTMLGYGERNIARYTDEHIEWQ